jgi:hypothetical protein
MITELINNQVNFINSDGILNSQNVNSLFSGKNLSTFDMRSGLVDNSTLNGVNNINHNSCIIDNSSNSVLNVAVTSLGNNQLTLELSGLTYSFNDENLKQGDSVFLDSVRNNEITDISGRYKIISVTSSISTIILTLEEQDTNVISGLTNSNFISSSITEPNFISIQSLKIKSSKVKSGLFRRTLFNSSKLFSDSNSSNKLKLINEFFLNSDNSFDEVSVNLIPLRIGVGINTNSIIYNSHLINSPVSKSSIVESIINDSTINDSIINSSYWLNGTLFNSQFLNSKGFTQSSPNYSFGSYYKAWNNGDFYSGEFNKSLWISGNFYSGKLFDSDWLSGTWSNGVLGDKSLKSQNTTFGTLFNTTILGSTNSLWMNGVVENAIVGGSSSVTWENGNFNSGIFTSYPGWASVWENGNFNSGLFEGNSTWENGNFNNGRFESIFGVGLESSTQSSDWAWQKGNFYNGIFGKGEPINNPSWFDGSFFGGIFKGKVWNNGTFVNGEFIGSGTYSAVSQTDEFISSFTSSNYWGIWRNGILTDDIFVSTPNLNTNVVREIRLRVPNISNLVWVSGTFSSTSASINNSVFLSGTFEKGNMNNSTFNPFTDSGWFSGSASGTQSFNISTNIIWKNGTFNDGNFNLSTWENGTFIRGTMSGTQWKGGTWNYGFANNVLWESGRWRNGNWDGSPFDYTNVNNSGVLDKKSSQITKWINDKLDVSEESYNKIHTINVGFATFSSDNLVPFVFSAFDDQVYKTTMGTWFWQLDSPNPGTASVISLPNNTFSEVLYPEILLCRENCELTDDVFWDTTIGYLVSINARSSVSTGIFLNLEIGGLTGPSSSFGLTAGQAGFNSNNEPIIHLNSTAGTYSFIYYPQEEDDKSFGIIAYNSLAPDAPPTPSNIDVRNITITKIESLYNETFNNNLVTSTFSTSTQLPFGNTFSTLYITPAEDSKAVSIRFGNGLFKSGVWENGVWNNGWRKDNNRYKFDSILNFVRISNFNYFLTISGTNSSLFEIGERVSISNICGVDFNGNKSLLKGSFRVLEKTNTTIRLEVVFSSNLRNIEIDSPNHKITITKNVWLSGAFLNGHFSGVMNYGLVKGYPMITNLNQTHLIDGIFDSGRISTTASTSYFSSLIQNLDFNDASYLKPIDRTDGDYTLFSSRNYSNLGVKNRRYLSWLDLNWRTDLYSNTFDDFSFYSSIFDTEIKNINHMSRVTLDVLRSNSLLRNVSNTSISNFNLGADYKKFTSTIPFNGNFNYTTLFVDNVGINTEGFFNRGWTFSNSISSLFITQSSTFSSNWNISPTQSSQFNNTLLIETERLSTGTLGLWNFTNSNSIFRRGRYSMVEMSIPEFSGDSLVETQPGFSIPDKYPRVYFKNKPNFGIPSLEENPINHLNTNNNIKREFFYNLEQGGFSIFAGSNWSGGLYGPSYSSVRFDYINFFEVDRIPFFRYYTDSKSSDDRIDRYVKVPNKAIAPEIDYSDTDFDFIGNITLTQDSLSTDIVNYPASPPPLKTLYDEVLSSSESAAPELDS